MIGIIVVIIITNVFMIAAVIILGIIGYKLAQVYTNAAKDIKRMEGIGKFIIYLC